MIMLEMNNLLPHNNGEAAPLWFARWMMFSVFAMLIGGIGWLACNWSEVYGEFFG